MPDAVERFLLIASHETGHDFMRQCAESGARPTLLTLDSLRDAGWPRDTLEDMATMPAGLSAGQILNTVSWMARGRRFDRVVALGEFDQLTAAQVREHMRLPGMGVTTASCYSDRLAMRVIAREFGFPVPAFCRVLNYDELRDFMDHVPPPWLLTPRTKASEQGIGQQTRRIDDPEQLWRALDGLGDLQSHFLLEQLVPGDLLSVDSIVSECRAAFSVVHRDGLLPRETAGESDVLAARTVERSSREWKELSGLNASLAPSLGMVRGITHARYLRAYADGRCSLLEIAAGVGGGDAAKQIESETGVNLWREWARLEIAHLRGEPYAAPEAAKQLSPG